MPFLTSGGSSVTSANIVDGEIIDADIAAAAAISLSKIANAPYVPLATVTLGGVALTIDSGTFAARTNLRILLYTPGLTIAGQISAQLNGDTGANYNRLTSLNGGAAAASGVTVNIDLEGFVTADPRYYVFDMANVATLSKVIRINGGHIGTLVDQLATWSNTSNQVTRIVFTATNTFLVGTRLVVLGMD